MDKVKRDSRFSHIVQDPRFRSIPKEEKKIKIDERFRAMFRDKHFQVIYNVDKRGRPISHKSSENLKKFYYGDSSEDDEESEIEMENGAGEEKTDLEKIDYGDSSEEEDDSEEGEIEVEKGKSKLKTDLKKCYFSNSSEEVDDEESEIRTINDKEKEKVNKSIDKAKEKSDLSIGQSNIINKRENLQNILGKHGGSSKNMDNLTNDVKEKLRDNTIDYARGKGVLLSDSSEESSEDSDDEFDHGWGQLDEDAEQTNEITNRLAVCNMNWDRIRATDLMVLFSSFLPKGGVIHSVTIYPSQYGRERMEKEDIVGPIEITDKEISEIDEKREHDETEYSTEEDEEGKHYHLEKLRQYQLNRLKYYYAILVFDSPETANKIYMECDRMEYESTASHLDLRFVPNDTIFDEEPKEVCEKIPDFSKYEPRYFITTALQQVKVDLTWDETSIDRSEITKKFLMTGKIDGISEADLQNYLASSSGDESDGGKNTVDEKVQFTNVGTGDSVSAYRALLQGIEEKESQKTSNNDMEMEISWGVDLKDKTDNLINKGIEKDELTPFEQYVAKRRATIKQKKLIRKAKYEESQKTSNNEDSDSDIPSDIDMNDPYFKEEFERDFVKIDKKKKKSKANVSDNEETKQEKAQLELLINEDDDDNKRHFNYKAIQKNDREEKKSRKKKWKKKLNEKDIRTDDFEINVKDERFSAIYSSHHYNIDPTDSHYRKTKAMEALQVEKLHRRKIENDTAHEVPVKMQKKNLSNKDPELSLLIKNIKMKTGKVQKGKRY